MMRADVSLRAAMLGLVVVVAAGVAHAAPPRAPAPARHDDADPDVEIARRYFAEGARAYEAQSYAAALEKFEAARRYKALPALDYNIGRCYDRMERFDEAIAAYRRFVDARPEPEGAADVRERIAVLVERRTAETRAADARRAEAAERERKAALEFAEKRRRATPPAWRAYLGPMLLGVGAVGALAAGGGVLGTVPGEYARLASGPSSCRPCTPAEISGVQTRAYIGYALIGVGAAAAAGDLAWFLIVRHRRAAAARAWLVPTGNGVAVSGVWP
jgi:tetratricopeptide (TPR) repeat protein